MGNESTNEKKTNSTKNTKETEVISTTEFTIVAEETNFSINEDTTLPVWSFNGSIPGSEIRVQQGDQLTIHLKNELSEPIAIHWHGVPVPNEMDGIPGVTMNAVQPGETFTYEFEATVPGTYWYHSHQNGAIQVDKGLYGAFIVEPKDKKQVYDKDFTLLLDEWASSGIEHGSGTSMGHGEHGGHSDNQEQETNANQPAHDMSMYDVFTINGNTADSSKPLLVQEGDKVRLRLINAGFMSHKIHLHGHDFKIIAVDGQDIHKPQNLKDSLIEIAPGERYDIEFTADKPGTWPIEAHGENEASKGMRTFIQYEGLTANGEKKDDRKEKAAFQTVNMLTYGKPSSKRAFTLEQDYDFSYTMDLGTETNGEGTYYTINGEKWPNIDRLSVKEGDKIKVTMRNTSPDEDHPMHLHGHFFQILSKNGMEVKGSPLMKDTINIKPGEEYTIAFQADNPGNWMFHCHDLHHASQGMVTQVDYKGYKSTFTPDPEVDNQPE